MPSLTAFFKWMKNGLMSIIFPVHMKRLVFLITLYHYIKKDPVDVDQVDQMALEELNTSLRIAKTGSQSLVLPGLMTKSIWDGHIPSDELLTCPLEQVMTSLLETVPAWMIYGSREAMSKDVDDIRRFITSHNAA